MMEHRVLGRTGFDLSVIGFGAWGIGAGQWIGATDVQSAAALRTAMEHGCNFIDTALVYGDGHSEELIAKFLSGESRRVTVATKVPPHNMLWPARRYVPLRDVFPLEHIRASLATSTRNLGGRRPDLLQLHVWRDEWLDEKEWPATAKLIEQLLATNAIGAFGISINDHEPQSALKVLRQCALVSSVQVIYNVFDQSPERELFPLCQERNIGVIARVPLDEGGLTGNIKAGATFGADDFRAQYFKGDRPAELQPKVDALRPLLTEEAATMVEGALRFCISHPAVTTVIPGMRTPEHAAANCAAGDGRHLTAGLLKRLKAHAWPRNWYPE
ncbi:MAG TPA: aldo/keto reductase [Gemmatimonadales bacterium]|jgi:aryl-alcohol dehydrogenase-like predicted oxidoreductase